MMRTLLIVMLLQSPIGAAQASEQLPWQQLDYQRKSFWGSVEAQLRLADVETEADRWALTVQTRVGNNNEERVDLLLSEARADVISKARYSRGQRAQRFKAFDYRGKQISRERRDPANDHEEKLAPDQWTGIDLQNIGLPKLDAEEIITTPYPLFVAVSDPALADPNHYKEVIVHTDYNFYRVRLQKTGEEQIRVNYQLQQGDSSEKVKSKKASADLITLSVTPVSEPSRPDFEVLGLRGDVRFLVDPATRLPLRIMGTAPRLGDTYLDLTGAIR